MTQFLHNFSHFSLRKKACGTHSAAPFRFVSLLGSDRRNPMFVPSESLLRFSRIRRHRRPTRRRRPRRCRATSHANGSGCARTWRNSPPTATSTRRCSTSAAPRRSRARRSARPSSTRPPTRPERQLVSGARTLWLW